MDEQQNLERGISFKELFAVAKQYAILIVVIMVLCIVAGGLYGQFGRPTVYTAEATVMVNVTDDNTADNQMSQTMHEYNKYLYASYLVNAFTSVIPSDAIIAQTNLKLEGKGYSYKKSNISFTVNDQNPVFIVTYQTTVSKEAAVDVLNTVLEVTKETYKQDGSFLQDKLEVLSSPKVENVIAQKDTVKFVIVFFLLGLIICCVIVFIKYFLDDTFKDKETIERITGTDVIAFIMCTDTPSDDKNGGKK